MVSSINVLVCSILLWAWTLASCTVIASRRASLLRVVGGSSRVTKHTTSSDRTASDTRSSNPRALWNEDFQIRYRQLFYYESAPSSSTKRSLTMVGQLPGTSGLSVPVEMGLSMPVEMGLSMPVGGGGLPYEMAAELSMPMTFPPIMTPPPFDDTNATAPTQHPGPRPHPDYDDAVSDHGAANDDYNGPTAKGPGGLGPGGLGPGGLGPGGLGPGGLGPGGLGPGGLHNQRRIAHTGGLDGTTIMNNAGTMRYTVLSFGGGFLLAVFTIGVVYQKIHSGTARLW